MKEQRPDNCRNRLADEGKLHPKSSCEACEAWLIYGCPYEGREIDWKAVKEVQIRHEVALQYPDINWERASVKDDRLLLLSVIAALREGLIMANLKIRSFPGADESDVEFINTLLKDII